MTPSFYTQESLHPMKNSTLPELSPAQLSAATKLAVFLSDSRVALRDQAAFARFVRRYLPALGKLSEEILMRTALGQPYTPWAAAEPPHTRPIVAFWTLRNPRAPHWMEQGCSPIIWSERHKGWIRTSDCMPVKQADDDTLKINHWAECPPET